MTFLLLAFLLVFLIGRSPNIEMEDLTAKEISLKESLIFAGIDANVDFSDETVIINYELPVKYEEDLILAANYILGAAYHEFPNSKYRLIYEIEDLAYFTETDSSTVESYLEGEISFLEFSQEVDVYVR